jgi:serine/threonine protein kinase
MSIRVEETGPAAVLAPAQASAVVRILEEYLGRLEGGAPPHPEELLARHPEFAEVLRAYLDKLDLLHQAAVSLRHSVPSPEATAASSVPELGQLGDFRLLREVGRGGMGVVYEAEQLSLGRRVALKVLPFAAALDAKQLQRFKNEAQAAAGLHHTNIVPVYAVGCERGVHFYAMQFIDGRTLTALIEELRRSPVAAAPTGPYTPAPAAADTLGPAAARSTETSPRDPGYFRTVAQIGDQAAEALEHAHQLGVIHRDVKPGNLLVETTSPLAPRGRGVGGS